MNRVEERRQTVIFLRHGVALHNIPDETTHQPRRLNDPSLTDPPLVETGKIQAVQAGARITEWLRAHIGGRIGYVVVSPLSRCIETAVLAFFPGTTSGSYNENGNRPIRFVCHEDVRETIGVHYPNRRRKKSTLEVRPFMLGLNFFSLTHTHVLLFLLVLVATAVLGQHCGIPTDHERNGRSLDGPQS
jgi:Histidine phosphatase superfamily (branch 1)